MAARPTVPANPDSPTVPYVWNSQRVLLWKCTRYLGTDGGAHTHSPMAGTVPVTPSLTCSTAVVRASVGLAVTQSFHLVMHTCTCFEAVAP